MPPRLRSSRHGAARPLPRPKKTTSLRSSRSGGRIRTMGDELTAETREMRRTTSAHAASFGVVAKSLTEDLALMKGAKVAAAIASGRLSPTSTRIIDPNEKLYPVVMDPINAPNVHSYLTMRELTDHVIGKTKPPKVGTDKKTRSTSLQLALDCSIPSAKLRCGACASLDNGHILAVTSTFHVTSDEIIALKTSLNDSINAFEEGIIVAGVKYEPFRADDIVIYARRGNSGVIVQRAEHFVCIGLYDESISPVNAVSGTEEMCQLLEREVRLSKKNPWLIALNPT